MKHYMLMSLIAATVLSVPFTAAARDPADDPSHAIIHFGIGPSETTDFALGGVSYNAHMDLGFGLETVADKSFAFGGMYLGSADINSTTLLQRHGIGLMFRCPWAFTILSGGLTLMSPLNDRMVLDTTDGWHIGAIPGFRVSVFQVSLPMYMDVVHNTAYTTVSLALGFQY